MQIRKTTILILLLLGATSQASASQRVISGTPANPADWPSMASVSDRPAYPYTRDSHPYCGGSVVAPRWILSAGHCFVFWRGEGFWGTAGRPDLLLPTGESSRGATVFLHPRFRESNWSPPYDAALLRLREPLSAPPATLAESSPGPGTAVKVAGFGSVNNINFQPSSTLLETTNQTITNDLCRQLSPRGAFFYFRSQLCTGTDSGTGACYGDSGGPLMRSGVLVGLVSAGDAFCRKGGRADVFTKVSGIRSWVLETIRRGNSRGSISFLKYDRVGRGRVIFIMQTNSEMRRARVFFNKKSCTGGRCWRAGHRFSLPRIPADEGPGRYVFIRFSRQIHLHSCARATVRVRFANGDLVVRNKRVCS